MTNNERAEQLAKIPWIGENGWPHGVLVYILAGQCADTLLPWLLRELPKRGCDVLYLSFENGNWRAGIVHEFGEWEGSNTDPLIALVDAVIAAHAERQAT